MSTPITEATVVGKMCYIRLFATSTQGERAKCLDYNDATRVGVFMLRGGECIMKYSIEIVSVASDQSPFSAPEPRVPITARSIVDRIKKFFA